MLSKGKAKKVTIYINEDTRYHHGPLYEAVMHLLLQRAVSGATATRCLSGFGSHHQLHTSYIFSYILCFCSGRRFLSKSHNFPLWKAFSGNQQALTRPAAVPMQPA